LFAGYLKLNFNDYFYTNGLVILQEKKNHLVMIFELTAIMSLFTVARVIKEPFPSV